MTVEAVLLLIAAIAIVWGGVVMSAVLFIYKPEVSDYPTEPEPQGD